MGANKTFKTSDGVEHKTREFAQNHAVKYGLRIEDETPVEDMTKAQLIEYASANEIEIPKGAKVAEIKEIILETQKSKDNESAL